MAWLQSGKLYSKELPGGGSCGFGVGHAVKGLGVTYAVLLTLQVAKHCYEKYPPRMPAGSLGFLAIGLRVEGYCGPSFVIQFLVMP